MDINQLCRACRAGDNSLVQAIMDTGEVDVNGTDQHRDTPLYWAMYCNHPSVVTTLLSSADTRLDVTNSIGLTGLHKACYRNKVSVITVFCSDARCTPAIINMKDRRGSTALMYAVELGHLETVREMARVKGTDFGTVNRMGKTLLEVARQRNKTRVFHFLSNKHYFASQLRTLKEIAAFNIAKYITCESDVKQLEIPKSLISLVTMYLEL
eukprot:GFUD01066830.1.p1 GENE.GFUD01066830.1~~GFUD01066830.1.p1  ORF type:complete len:211 (+),score=40.92 GFUD01066830.1:58-690(+)